MSSLIGQRGLFQNNPNRFSPAQRKGANPGQAPVLKPSHVQQQIPTPAAKLSVQTAPVQTKKLSSAPAISSNLWQQQAGNLLKQYGPSVMRQFGPSLGRKIGLPLAQRLGPPLARKVGMPLVQRVGLPLARKVFLPLAKRVGFALIRRMGFPF
ncbi:MAG TPA: hypothetical protein VFC84_16685 [Desulfosporosinus sp.]|nr:hypothetical protein [Desulfosporosinus sp.]